MLLRNLGVVWLLQSVLPTACIVNREQETANMVIYMRKPTDILPKQGQDGVECSFNFGTLYFGRYSNLTRALNAVYTISENLSYPANYIQSEFLPKLHKNLLQLTSTRKSFLLSIQSDSTKNRDTKSGNAVPTDYYLIILDRVEQLSHLINNRLVHLEAWNPRAFFFIVYHNSEDYNNQMSVTQAISKEMQNHFVDNVSILYAKQENLYVFLVNNFLNAQNCRTVNWKMLGECRNGVMKPEKKVLMLSVQQFLKSYGRKNCTLRICATVAQPFIEPGCMHGIEMQMLNNIGSYLKIQATINCTHLSRGTLKKNGKWTGLLGELSKGTCDMAVGGFYPDNEVKTQFWVSQTYLEDKHTWFIKKADLQPPWKALITIFQGNVWICCLLVLLFIWISWYFLVKYSLEPEHHKGLSLAAINAIAVSICVSINERPLHHVSRILFYTVALYGLNFMTIFTSRLIVVFKDPGYMYQIKTLEESNAANIPYGGPAESMDWFEDDEYITDKYNNTEYFLLNDTNIDAVARGERVILGGQMYMMQSKLSSLIFPFEKTVFSSPLQFFMNYGAPYQKELSIQVLFCNDFGINTKLNNDFLYNNTYLNRISKLRPQFKSSHSLTTFLRIQHFNCIYFTEQAIVLTTAHFQGPFAVLIVGSLGSILVFLGELACLCLKTRMLQQKNVPEYQKVRNEQERQELSKDENFIKTEQRRNEKKEEMKKTYGVIKKRSTSKIVISKPWFK